MSSDSSETAHPNSNDPLTESDNRQPQIRNPKSAIRNGYFWFALIALALLSAWFAVKNFSRAFPIVSLDISMNRAAALERARELAAKHRFGPDGFSQAASFRGDQEVQNFVELEAGGTAAFREMLSSGLYHPFKWMVRHFKESETRETRIWFTPRGEPCGFAVKLPEKEPGAALEAAPAQSIAERAATADWGIDLGSYQLVEKSREVRPGGRIDHTFVYERPNARIGEGRYRIRLVVGGDRLIELTNFVKIPEAFSRRYEQMRSANNVILVSASAAMLLLYIAGGCGIGLFFLLRQRWIVWRAPVAWGVFIAFLQLLAGINEWPLRWLDYDTAVTLQGFVMQQVVLLLLTFLGYAFLFSISFMAAESLTRRAFPRHLQFWRLWSPEVAASKAMLGRTMAGYLLVAVFFGYEVLLYFVATRGLGWWMPSDTLVQPDVLASYLPWLSSIAISAQAGFWEECMFRAIPLACAALLGNRFGRRGWWIAGTMLLQALVFGAGHASYANQPSYARMVELIIPSLMFGELYLSFGLWPGIVLHFVFDVVWMALPLFVSNTPGIWMDRALVVILTLIPVWVVLAGRLRRRAWTEVSDKDRNSAWQPPEPRVAAPAAVVTAPLRIHPFVVRLLPVAGFVGLLLWAALTAFRPESPSLNLGRAQARHLAVQALKERGIELSTAWKVLPRLEASPDQQDRFVWQSAGRETYKRLLGEFLEAPHWTVRFVRFEGDVAERAEEYRVSISGNGNVTRFQHMLPEERPGRSFSEAEARGLARSALKELFKLDAGTLKEVSAAPSKLKNRTDWLFIFSDSTKYKLAAGDTRIAIQIAGDQVVDGYRFVHVPEEWARRERDLRVVPGIIQAGSIILVVVGAIGGIVVAIVSWSRKKFSVAAFLALLGVFLLTGVGGLANGFPAMMAQFSTAQPYQLQLGIFVIGGGVGILLMAIGISILGGYVARASYGMAGIQPLAFWISGISLGALIAGIEAALSKFGPQLSPAWADLGFLAFYFPLLDGITNGTTSYLDWAILGLLFLGAISQMTRGWTCRKMPAIAVIFLLGFVAAGYRGVESIPWWLVTGLVAGIFIVGAYLLMLRAAPELILVAIGAYQVLEAITGGLSRANPSALPYAAIRSITILLALWYLGVRSRSYRLD